MNKLLAALCLSLIGIAGATAQTVPIAPNLFGINYWYYDYASGFDSFDAKKAEVKNAGITLVRLGGLLPQKKLALSDMPHFDLAIDRVNSIGATPLMQLPINLAPADIPVWVAHFKEKGITYWSIGNEPEPTSNFAEWFKGIPVTAGGPVKRENGNTYAEFRDKFVVIARAIKAADPAAIVVGPDFHQFYGTTNASDPLMSYYPAFIADVGTRLENGVPLLDVFALHYYGFNPELDNKKRFDVLQAYINSANAVRSNRVSQLRFAVSEVNATTSTNTGFNPSLVFPWDFEAGQFFASVTRNAVINGGEFVAPWSVYESSGSKGATDFSVYNTNGMPRSTMVHFSLLAKNRRATWMTDAMTGSGGNSITYFGMTDGDGSTVMLMNTTTLARSYSVRLDGNYSTGSANTKFWFNSANHNAVEWVGNLAAKTTYLFTVDANGRRLKKVEYNKTISDAAQTNSASIPLTSDLTVNGAVAGDWGDISLSALLPAGVARSKLEFYVDGVLVGSKTQAPYMLVDASKMSKGAHTMIVAAYDSDGNVDRSLPVAFNVVEPDLMAPVTTDNAPRGWVNQDITVNFTATDAGSGVALTYFTVNGGAQQSGTAVALSAEGSYALAYWSVDQVGNVEAKHTVTVSIDKTAPQVAPLFNASANILSLNASDLGSGIASAEVSTDGGATWLAHNGATVFNVDGSYVVLYRVLDKAGNQATGQTPVQVVTVPVVTAPANQAVPEGAAASIDLGSFTDRNLDSPWTVTTDWGDGSLPTKRTAANAGAIGSYQHAFADNGTYTVTVKVSDRAGSASGTSFKVDVSNAAPVLGTINAVVPASPSGKTTTVSANFTDSGTVDSHSARIDWGDGEVSEALVTSTAGSGNGGLAGSHDYKQPALYVVTVTLTDKDGGVGTARTVVSWKCDNGGGRAGQNGNGSAGNSKANRCNPASPAPGQ
jgi:hypothetical protein